MGSRDDRWREHERLERERIAADRELAEQTRRNNELLEEAAKDRELERDERFEAELARERQERAAEHAAENARRAAAGEPSLEAEAGARRREYRKAAAAGAAIWRRAFIWLLAVFVGVLAFDMVAYAIGSNIYGGDDPYEWGPVWAGIRRYSPQVGLYALLGAIVTGVTWMLKRLSRR